MTVRTRLSGTLNPELSESSPVPGSGVSPPRADIYVLNDGGRYEEVVALAEEASTAAEEAVAAAAVYTADKPEFLNDNLNVVRVYGAPNLTYGDVFGNNAGVIPGFFASKGNSLMGYSYNDVSGAAGGFPCATIGVSVVDAPGSYGGNNYGHGILLRRGHCQSESTVENRVAAPEETLPYDTTLYTAWQPSTAITLTEGGFPTNRINGDNIYVCTTAGTTASSGGPTGTGTNIVDGTVHWDYVKQHEINSIGHVFQSLGAASGNYNMKIGAAFTPNGTTTNGGQMLTGIYMGYLARYNVHACKNYGVFVDASSTIGPDKPLLIRSKGAATYAIAAQNMGTPNVLEPVICVLDNLGNIIAVVNGTGGAQFTGLVGADDLRAADVRFVPQANTTAFVTPAEGWTYYDSTVKKLRLYDGAAWKNSDADPAWTTFSTALGSSDASATGTVTGATLTSGKTGRFRVKLAITSKATATYLSFNFPTGFNFKENTRIAGGVWIPARNALMAVASNSVGGFVVDSDGDLTDFPAAGVAFDVIFTGEVELF